jgi:hypothetical protein
MAIVSSASSNSTSSCSSSSGTNTDTDELLLATAHLGGENRLLPMATNPTTVAPRQRGCNLWVDWMKSMTLPCSATGIEHGDEKTRLPVCLPFVE